MDPDTVPEIDPVKALHRAVREYSVTEGRRKIMEAVVAEDDDLAVVVNLLELQQVTRRKMAKVTVDTLVWDKTAGCWLAQGTHQHAEQLRDRVADRQLHHDGNSVRDLLVQPALQASTTLRRGRWSHASAERWPRPPSWTASLRVARWRQQAGNPCRRLLRTVATSHRAAGAIDGWHRRRAAQAPWACWRLPAAPASCTLRRAGDRPALQGVNPRMINGTDEADERAASHRATWSRPGPP